ncbi:MAG: decarboxylating 6-phosphogluconate dehydrogenase [Chloroflexota bacterium]|nr:decarboxylating 6-phosphogluconate dehydrogenase [Chloroflexota bacterium]
MQLGFVGLGRMGGNMVTRLVRGGHEVVAFNRSPGPVQEAVRNGAVGASSLRDLVDRVRPPRHIWLMLPAGGVTDQHLDQLMELCQPGDLFVDGANSRWKDTMARAERIKARGFEFVDCGTSGGIWGLQVGYSIMAGGSREAFARVEPAVKTLAPENGYGLMGANGAGHFVKMVHNGIEYGMMQAYAEGFQILEKSEYDLDLLQVSRVWQHGSVVRSWLLDLMVNAFEKDPRLEGLEGWVDDSGEGRWTVEAAIEEDVPATVIAFSLFSRFYSRDPNSFSWRVLAALRNEFGGHAVRVGGRESGVRSAPEQVGAAAAHGG